MNKRFVDLFIEAHRTARSQITLDLDATDDPLPGEQERRFLHGYYKSYCYLPLYIFCRRHLLCAKLRRANIDVSAGSVEEVARIVGQIRESWPKVRILLRADSGFTRDDLMTSCEKNDVDYLFGPTKNTRLIAEIAAELAEAAAENHQSCKPAYLDAQATARATERLDLQTPFWPRHRADGLGRWWDRRSDIRGPDHRDIASNIRIRRLLHSID